MTDYTPDDKLSAIADDAALKRTILKAPKFIDDILSKEVLQLSLKDRNAIEEEIHGVSTLAPVETSKFLEASLQELAMELNNIPDDNPCKAAYIESQMFQETYVNSPDFRLRFLRCELFHAKKAAIRMVRFLSLALDLYGPVVLQRPMTISDLSREEKKVMLAGYLQVLPYRDRSGRLIFAFLGDFGFQQGSIRSRNRVFLYIQYAYSDDVESQKKGMIKLLWVGPNAFDGAFPDWQNAVYAKRMFQAIPLRLCAVHCCTPDTFFFHMYRTAYGFTLGGSRSRLQFHIGEEVELLYKLRTYGIPVETIPVRETGKIQITYLKRWMRGRKVLEEMRERGNYDESSTILYPGSNDVLFRRGVSLTCHPGNSKFQDIIQSRIREHSTAATQIEKTGITKSIIRLVQERGGRFLQWDDQGWWMEIKDATQILTKVANQVKLFKFKPIAGKAQTVRSCTFLFQSQDNTKRRKTSDSRCDCACFSLYN